MEQNLTLAYLAGLFDGEGTVTLSKRKSSDQYRTPTLSLTSTTRVLVDLCGDQFGGWIVTKKTYRDHHKEAWSWYISGDKALEAIASFIHFIHEPEKRYRMQLLLDQYKLVTPRNGKYNEFRHQQKAQFEVDFFHPSNTIT